MKKPLVTYFRILACLVFVSCCTLTYAHSVSSIGSGEDWFFPSTACDRAKENVVPQLKSECRFHNWGELVGYHFETDTCSCSENQTQPRFVCKMSAEGECNQ